MSTTFDLGQRRVFVAHSRHEPSYDLGLDETSLRSLVMDKWSESFESKRPETERLKTCELYYAGFHYEQAWLNRVNPVTNFCFSHIETVWPILIETKPRPEIVPRNSLAMQHATDLQDYAQWLMDASWFDQAVGLGTRDKLKFGWNAHLITFDPQSGMPIPRPLSVFHYYPDPAARNESELECFTIGMPVATRRLRALFPKALGEIKPDNIADPGYEVFVRPYRMAMFGTGSGPGIGPTIVGPSLTTEGQSSLGTSVYGPAQGDYREFGQTTFVIQLFIRDHGKNAVSYQGDRYDPDPDDESQPPIKIPYSLRRDEPRSASGWSVISMTASGTLLEAPGPLDPAYGGIPIVVGRDYASSDRYFARGELDDLIPIQRDINRRYALLNKSLELAANPPILADTNAGLNVNQTTIEGGEILKKRPGSQVDYLKYQSPAEWHFNMIMMRGRDIDTVGGAADVTQGHRPPGIEAGVAIQRLQAAAQVRIRGKVPEMMREYSLLLKKLMIAAGRKFKHPIAFYARGGRPLSISPDALLSEFEIRFAEGTGTATAKQEQKDEALAYYQAGLVDEQYVWEVGDLKGREELGVRMEQRRAEAAAQQAELAAESAGARKGASVGGPS